MLYAASDAHHARAFKLKYLKCNSSLGIKRVRSNQLSLALCIRTSLYLYARIKRNVHRRHSIFFFLRLYPLYSFLFLLLFIQFPISLFYIFKLKTNNLISLLLLFYCCCCFSCSTHWRQTSTACWTNCAPLLSHINGKFYIIFIIIKKKLLCSTSFFK